MTVLKTRPSTIYVKVPISGTLDGAAIDVTQDSVYLAIVSRGTDAPAAGDWYAGDWETNGATTSARLLVGPEGDLDLPAGRYDVWTKVIDSPEIPVDKAGVLVVK